MYLTLSSGARLIVEPTPSPVAAVYIWVCAGSADERPGEHGAAHFVEHMLFKGTERRGVGEAVAAIEACGGDVNAWTSLEETVYHATVPAGRWAEALETLLDMVLHSRFDEREVENERGVILEEIRGGRDDPGRLLGEAVQAAAWRGHPYARPVIGSSRSVAALSREALLAFWRRWYTPANLVIAIVGGVGAEAAARVEALLPAAGPAPDRPPRPVLAPQRRRRMALVSADFEEPLVELAFPAVALGHPDEPALELLAEVLAGGSSSVLHRRLQREAELATATWATLDAERDGGLLLVGAAPRRGRAVEVLAALAEVLGGVAAGAVGASEVRRAAAGLRSGRLFELESVDGRAADRARSAAVFDDPRAGDAFAAALAVTDLAAVRAAAGHTLDLSRCTVGALVRPGALDAAAVREALRPPAVSRRIPADRIHRRVLSGGLTVVVEEDEDHPVVAARLVGLGGQLSEHRRSAGRCSVWARAVVAGAGELPYEALSDAVAERGGSLGGFSGMNTMGLRADFPADALGDCLSLVAAVARAPRFEVSHVRRVIAEQIEAWDYREDDPAGLAWERAQRLLYGAHPYGLIAGGTPGTLRRVTRGALVALHRRLLTRDNLVLSVVGPVEAGAVFEAAERLLSALPEGPMGLRPRPPLPPPRRRRARIRTAREQAHLVLVWPGARLLDPDQPALELAAELLGRQGGRLFEAVRERLGLVYTVSASDVPAWDAGLLGVSLACEPGRLEQAAAVTRAEVRRLARQPPGAEELEAARELLAGLAVMDRQRAGSRAIELALWERYGVRAQRQRAWRAERLERVSARDVSRALAARLDGEIEVAAVPL